jgi:Enolase, C-terminal TIM barrel domain
VVFHARIATERGDGNQYTIGDTADRNRTLTTPAGPEPVTGAGHFAKGIEDRLVEEVEAGWRQLTSSLGDRVQMVGDGLSVTKPEHI